MPENARRNEPRLEGGGLLQSVLPMLWSLLCAEDRRSLRATCQATRQGADCLLTVLRYQQSGAAPAGGLLELAAAWRGMLGRGARPRKLDLQLLGLPSSTCAKFALYLLPGLHAVSPPVALEDVRLEGLPLTTAVVRAIAAAAPQLSALHLSRYDMSRCTGLRRSLPFSNGLSGVQGLLRHAAPHLRELTLEGVDTWAAAPWLPPLLLQCSRLTSLSLAQSEPSEALLGALPALSQLTRLSLNISSDAQLPAVAQLRWLAELDLTNCTLRPGGLQLLAGLGALKILSVATVEIPQQQPGGDDVAVPPQTDTLPLPPVLESLTVADHIHPTALAALCFPDSLAELSIWESVTIDRDADLDDDDHLRPAAAEALLAACEQLEGVATSASLSLGWCKPPRSWPKRFDTLYDTLQLAEIELLDLRHVELTAADVAALVERLPALEALYLTCHAPPYTWPLLGRLERLRVLRLCPGIGNTVEYWEEFGSEPALRAALLSLCLEAPRLERLELALMSPYNDDEITAASAMSARAHCKAAAKWLAGVLPRLRASPPTVVCDLWDTDGSWDFVWSC